MNWWNEFADRVHHDVPLGRMTWFGLGGCTRHLFHPDDSNDLSRFMQRALDESVGVKVLGCGANVLVRDDGYDGVVVRLDAPWFKQIEWLDDGVRVGAGVDLMPLAKSCSAEGWTGLEPMAGIPASVGGAIRMNAGGRFGSFGDIVRTAKLLMPDGSIETWHQNRLAFGYRQSAVGNRVVLSAELALKRCEPSVSKTRFAELFEWKTGSQPLAASSAGCIFKNPPEAPAGALIDRAGLKGTSCGSASVSRQHANFIVTEANATSADVLALIDVVRDSVAKQFGTQLELEVDIW